MTFSDGSTNFTAIAINENSNNLNEAALKFLRHVPLLGPKPYVETGLKLTYRRPFLTSTHLYRSL